MCQIIVMKKSARFLMKEDAGWGGFAGDSFHYIYWFSCEGYCKGSPIIKCIYLACLKVLLWFVFVIYGFFILVVHWKKAYSEPCVPSEVDSFAKLVNDWKQLIFFSENLILDIWKDSEYASPLWKVNCKFCYILQFEITCIFCHFSTTPGLQLSQNNELH